VRTRLEGEHTVVEVSGRIARRARAVRVRRRVGDPGRFFATTLADRFARLTGTEPIAVTRGAAPSDAMVVARHASAPLPEVLHSALSYSNNFTIEQVLRTLGARASGRPGDGANGRAAVERFFAAIGRDPTELVFVNASGYSRRGRVSADALVHLLRVSAGPDAPSSALVPSLPAPGERGTLRHRLPRARGRVRAKTGTLRGANALSGIVRARDGHRYGFSILVNGTVSSARAHRIQDRIVMALLDHQS
jgi:D-alanyl-D-alanine carboxypeptidase/D-alanyl-D-alanine-endopeptidase (penicillin-binding protein 4)